MSESLFVLIHSKQTFSSELLSTKHICGLTRLNGTLFLGAHVVEFFVCNFKCCECHSAAFKNSTSGVPAAISDLDMSTPEHIKAKLSTWIDNSRGKGENMFYGNLGEPTLHLKSK